MRHAAPVTQREVDGSFPLSDQGIAIHQKVLESLHAQGLRPQLVIHSPVLRAQQTAELTAEYFDASLEMLPALGLEMDSESVLEKLQNIHQGEIVCMVGHAPSMAQFVERLAGSPCLPLGLSKSGVAIAKFKQPCTWGSASFVECFTPSTMP